MAEFCRECFFKLNPNERYIPVLSRPWDKDLCEGCGKWKRVVVSLRPPFLADLIGCGYYIESEEPRKKILRLRSK